MQTPFATPSHFPGQTWSSTPRTVAGPTMQAGPDAFCAGAQHTQMPIVTGTSVLGIKYKGGILLAADTLASYGSLARFMDIRRIVDVGANTILGASGDMSDFQHTQTLLEKLMIKESNEDDDQPLSPEQVYAYLSRVMYQRRSKMNPLWNAYVLGGVDQKTGEPFLGFVDLLGTTYTDSVIATGFGLHIAIPLLRKSVVGREHEITEDEGKKILQDCLKILYYRDARSINRFITAKVTKEGTDIDQTPKSNETDWGFAEGLRGYGPQSQ